MKSKIAVWLSAMALPAALCAYMAATAHPAHGAYGVVSGVAAGADNNGCSNATLKGDYGYGANGISVTIPPVGSVAILGKITADGKGDFSGSANGSIAGNILTDMPITGTYSIASDCTGTLTTFYPAFTAQFSLVLVEGVEGRREAWLLETDAGTVATGTIKPVSH
jgi:hypothetical protein